MSEAPFTKLRNLQYRGPSTSDDYNARIQENYKDLVVLKNQSRVLSEHIREGYARILKDQDGIVTQLADLESRVLILESSARGLTFYTNDQIDNDIFIGTPFEIASTSQCSFDGTHGILTLPKIDTSSLSKYSFSDPTGRAIIPSSLETRVQPVEGSADDGTALIDTSEVELSILNQVGQIWERNVIVGAPNINGAQLFLYIKNPTDLFTTPFTNSILIHPFPSLGVQVTSVFYSTSANILMDDTDSYQPVNDQVLYSADSNAVGWVPPGGWPGDGITNCGYKLFIFDQKEITGLKIGLRQDNYYHEGTQYIYSYGLSSLDLRFSKYLPTGSTMIRFSAVAGTTISNILNVQPQIYNVSPVELPDVFSYQVVWETALNSGVYTLSPVPLSTRVWLNVTLNATAGQGSPALNGITLSYS